MTRKGKVGERKEGRLLGRKRIS